MNGKIPVDAIYFDFDGTIGETEPGIRSAWKRAIAELRLECPDFDRIFRVGPSLQETSLMLFPQEPPERHEIIRATYRHYYDDAPAVETRPYPWCEAILAELRRRGKKLFIVTNKRKKPTMNQVGGFGFIKYFAAIITPDCSPATKVLTKNQMLQLAVNVSGIPPERGLMVGDTELDIAAGRSGGTYTCAVPWGYGIPEKVAAAKPDLMISGHDFIDGFDRIFC